MSDKPIAIRQVMLGLGCLFVAAMIWLPTVHLFFKPESEASFVKALSKRQIHLWENTDQKDAEITRMRQANAEWDFMGRSYLVWAYANLCFREPENKAFYLKTIDTIIDDTLQTEKEMGPYHFLMGYAKARPFVMTPVRSQFVDGEIALMIAMRRLVEDSPRHKALHKARVNVILERMEASPTMSAESYPDECWLFCNIIAVNGVYIQGLLDGESREGFVKRWIDIIREKLVDKETGLLVSEYTLDGKHLDGPEGTSIWMVIHCLQILDEAFAQDQYKRAKSQLARSFLGCGYSKEWPDSWVSVPDIDSGPIVPGLKLSPGASGIALIAAKSMNDDAYYNSLRTSLGFSAFPVHDENGLRFCASNQVGDAVMLYAAVQGPIWAKVKQLKASAL